MLPLRHEVLRLKNHAMMSIQQVALFPQPQPALVPQAAFTQPARMLVSRGKSLHFPEWGFYAGVSSQIFYPCSFYLGIPAFPGGAWDWHPPRLPSTEECAHTPSTGLSGGPPGLTQGGSSVCEAMLENMRERWGGVRGGDRERGRNIFLRTWVTAPTEKGE